MWWWFPDTSQDGVDVCSVNEPNLSGVYLQWPSFTRIWTLPCLLIKHAICEQSSNNPFAILDVC